MMFEQRTLFASLAAFTLLQMFPKMRLRGYQAHDFGARIDFVLEERLDASFLRLFEEALTHNLPLEPYPMTMMGSNAAVLLSHQGQKQLAESVAQKPLVELVKWGETALPASHVPWQAKIFKPLEINDLKDFWRLELAIFPDKEGLKQFLKNYAKRDAFDPLKLAVRARLITPEGLWLDKGLTLLEELRHAEESFWKKRGFERVFLGREGVLPPRALLYAPIVNKPLNVSMLEYDNLRLWAIDREEKTSKEVIERAFAALKAPQKWRRASLYLADPLGSFYETARIESSRGQKAFSLFASPIQALGLFLQQTAGNLEALYQLKKEMFENSC